MVYAVAFMVDYRPDHGPKRGNEGLQRMGNVQRKSGLHDTLQNATNYPLSKVKVRETKRTP
jgi:hypothetical protein